VVQWLRLCTSNVGGMASNPVLRTRIPHAIQHSKKKKKVTSAIPLLGILTREMKTYHHIKIFMHSDPDIISHNRQKEKPTQMSTELKNG